MLGLLIPLLDVISQLPENSSLMEAIVKFGFVPTIFTLVLLYMARMWSDDRKDNRKERQEYTKVLNMLDTTMKEVLRENKESHEATIKMQESLVSMQMLLTQILERVTSNAAKRGGN